MPLCLQQLVVGRCLRQSFEKGIVVLHHPDLQPENFAHPAVYKGHLRIYIPYSAATWGLCQQRHRSFSLLGCCRAPWVECAIEPLLAVLTCGRSVHFGCLGRKQLHYGFHDISTTWDRARYMVAEQASSFMMLQLWIRGMVTSTATIAWSDFQARGGLGSGLVFPFASYALLPAYHVDKAEPPTSLQPCRGRS